ncbi:MAG: hypothetical protein NTY53_20110 [Kiritimatiellaeota bacterium]|nr:hypothetical protein [Kiritimatiellota bacterium]
MQKLVTIYLDNGAYREGRMLITSFADKHGLVEEYLQKYLTDGWTIKQVSGFGGNAESPMARGWLAVLLEKEQAPAPHTSTSPSG